MDFLNSNLVRISQEGMYDIYVVKGHITCFVLMEAERRLRVWTQDHAPYEIEYETIDEAVTALKTLIRWISA
jgi:hypothetical protein